MSPAASAISEDATTITWPVSYEAGPTAVTSN
jgi:hypothetical protein